VLRTQSYFRLIPAITLVAVLAACAAAPAPAPTATPVVLPTDSAGLPLVASVNGEGIRQDLFERELIRYQQQVNAADPQALRAEVLDNLIEQVLILQEAARQQVVVSDAEVEAELAANRDAAGGAESWQRWLSDNLYAEDEFRAALRVTLITNRRIERVTADLNGSVPQVRARHILMNTEQEANDILARLRNGEDFASLALLSQDASTRDQGGDLGWFTQGELIDPALAAIAFSLEPNQIAGPIPSVLGYHVIQTLERADAPITDDRRPQLMQKAFEDWLEGLTTSARIERYI
jgi:parvulin-like peptidyl-prolyl isomerase